MKVQDPAPRAPGGDRKPAWQLVAQNIEAEIRAGRLAPGEKLPVEPELSARYGVGRHTLRRAIAALADRGVVLVRQGSGMYVNDDAMRYVLGRRTRFTEVVTRQNRSPSGTLISEGEVNANERVAEHLNVAVGTACVLIETLQRVDGAPMSIVSHHFPLTRFSGLADAYKETGSISLALARFDAADYVRRSTTLTAAMPDARDRRLLELPKNTPIIVTEAVNVDRDGTPLEYGLGRSSPLQLQIVVES